MSEQDKMYRTWQLLHIVTVQQRVKASGSFLKAVADRLYFPSGLVCMMGKNAGQQAA